MRLTALLASIVVAGVVIWYVFSDSREGRSPASMVESNESPPSLKDDPEPQQTKSAIRTSPTVEPAGNLPPRLQAIEPDEFQVTTLDPIERVADTWKDTYDALIGQADRGNDRAQYHLYKMAHMCFRGPRTAAELQEWLDEATAPYYDGTGSYVAHDPSKSDLREQGESILEFCRGATPERLARYPDWLEKAAESGNPRAMLRYGEDYPSDDDLDPTDDSDREIIERRRTKYIDYLEQARSLGSIDALWRLAAFQMNSDSRQVQKDAYSNLYAYAWYRLRYEGSDGSFKYLERIGNRLSPLENQEAIEEGRRILAATNCCFKIPELK